MVSTSVNCENKLCPKSSVPLTQIRVERLTSLNSFVFSGVLYSIQLTGIFLKTQRQWMGNCFLLTFQQPCNLLVQTTIVTWIFWDLKIFCWQLTDVKNFVFFFIHRFVFKFCRVLFFVMSPDAADVVFFHNCYGLIAN